MRSALVACALLAGCLAPSVDDVVSDLPVDPALALVVDHDHFDLEAHDVAWNLALRDWNGLAPKGTPSGAHAVDLHEDKLVVAVSDVADVRDRGFDLFDVSDPRKPALLGTYRDERTESGDRTIMFSGDGKTVFQAAERQNQDALLLAVDVSDPAKPTLAAEFPVPPYGPHTLYAEEIDGVQYVYVISFGLQVFRYEDGEFTLVGRYVAATPQQLLANEDGPEQTRTYAFRDVYGHDLFAWKDPVEGKHLAFVAHAYEGLKIVDLSNPRVPQELGTFVPDGPDAPSYVHTVTVKMFGERRIAAVGAETFESRNRDIPSPVWILDVTDLANPELLHTWTNPEGAGSNDLLLSAHDMRFDEVGGRTYLWLAHYHAGVWVLDMTDPANPTTAGFYLPHEDQGYVPPSNCCSGLRMDGIPLTFDVVARDGVGYAADMWSGLYTLELGTSG